MSQDCYCNLYDVRNFGTLLDDVAEQRRAGSLSEWVASVTALGAQSEAFADVETASPRVASIDVQPGDDSASLSWQSRNYPSLEFVAGLAKLYPQICFEFDWESMGYSKGTLACEDGQLGEVSEADFNLAHWDLLIAAGILDINTGETRDLGKTAECFVQCVSDELKDDRRHKTFSVQFSADDSLMVTAILGPTGACLDYAYSDADGNGDFEENDYADEFLSDLQD